MKSCSYSIEPSGQEFLEAVLKNKMTAEKYEKGVKLIRDVAGFNGIDKALKEHRLDVIMGPMDGRIPTIAAAAGYPVGTVPLGYSKTNGRPFGVCIVTTARKEEKIFRAMSAWNAMCESDPLLRRQPPALDVTWPTESAEKYHSPRATYLST